MNQTPIIESILVSIALIVTGFVIVIIQGQKVLRGIATLRKTAATPQKQRLEICTWIIDAQEDGIHQMLLCQCAKVQKVFDETGYLPRIGDTITDVDKWYRSTDGRKDFIVQDVEFNPDVVIVAIHVVPKDQYKK